MSGSQVQIPLKSLTPEPIVDSFGDCLPSGLKHHVVAHVGEELGVGLVSPRRCRYLPVGSRTVVVCAENKQRCGHRASIGTSDHLIQSGTRALGFHTGRAGFDDRFGGVRAEQVFTCQCGGVKYIGCGAEGTGAQKDPWVTAEHAHHGSS